VKKVVTMHDLIVMRFPECFKPADRVIHRLKMRHACRVADVVVAISEQTKRDLVELMGIEEEKIRVVYQSCDSAFWGVKGSEEGVKGSERTNVEVREKYGLPERYILCVGTLEERKNQMRVIEAMKRLPEEVALVLVGRPRGTYGQQILQSASDRIRLLSKADFADFPALYNGAVASVYMSRFEGFGIPVLESMCCDCPVLTSNVSSMPEAGGDAALYAAPDDVEAIARQLLRLCEDEDLRQQCIEKGRIHRMKFAPEKVSADMMAVYRSLLDN
jgi:glycosyltransferase involved in cell wall biosynthesis